MGVSVVPQRAFTRPVVWGGARSNAIISVQPAGNANLIMTTNTATAKNPNTYSQIEMECAALHALATQLLGKVTDAENAVPEDDAFRDLKHRAQEKCIDISSLLMA